MRTRAVLKLPIVLATASVILTASAPADTIATFADPASDGSTPLFTLSGSTLSGDWSDTGLDLITPISGDEFPDATFTMTDLTVLDPEGSLSGGTIEFFDNGGSSVLRIDFDAGQLFSPFGFGASTLVGHNVTFSGPIITIPLVEESFAFSFANQVTTPDGFTWTAAFTSSAIPEPATLTLLIVGGIATGVSRRRA
ncbi:MAG: PEP-CTERM sorting domain-containing protein [Phycisphaerae bacterium]